MTTHAHGNRWIVGLATLTVSVGLFVGPSAAADGRAPGVAPYVAADSGSYMAGLTVTDASRLDCQDSQWGLFLRPAGDGKPVFEGRDTATPSEVAMAWSALTATPDEGERIIFANSSINDNGAGSLEDLGLKSGDYALGALCVTGTGPDIGQVKLSEGAPVGEWLRIRYSVDDTRNPDKTSFEFVDGDAFDADAKDFPWWGVAGIVILIGAAAVVAWWYATKRRRI